MPDSYFDRPLKEEHVFLTGLINVSVQDICATATWVSTFFHIVNKVNIPDQGFLIPH